MARFTTNLTVTTPNETVSAVKAGDYDVALKLNAEVDSSDTPITLVSASATAGQNTLRGCKALLMRNSGQVGVEIVFKAEEWADASPDTNGGASHQSFLIPSGDFLYLPNLRQLNYETATTSAANGETLDNQAPDSNMYVDSTADLDHATSATMGSDATHTTVNLENGHSKFFKVGDLIRIENEICEVTAVGTGADLANSTCTIKRGMYGSTAATHADDVAIRFPFFNAYADFDKYSTAQTDGSGRYKAMNLFGYGRKGDLVADGFVAGSISGKFYSAGYQELGMSGITSATESGLVASTAYAFDIAVDGGSDYTLSFTTSSNTKFGGSDGVIQKIQDALDAGYYASGNLLEKRVTVGIVNGDIRFTSGQHLSTSAISISAPASGTTPFGVGRFVMAVGDIEAAVAAQLPDDVIYDKKTNQSNPNVAAMFHDDGHGNISGACTGTINYETGAIDLHNCPPNANFVISAAYGSAHSGGEEYGATLGNTIGSIAGRSVNPKINSSIEIIGLK
tara:strand:- start:11051 stop:12580 length:1530 start_codon:yes stop_codon:yes gene_type:complete